jgi:hypothetical protein
MINSQSPCRLLTALATLAATCGCSGFDTCPDARDRITIEHKDGTTDLTTLTFESAPASGPLTPFPANTEVMFEHGLGVTPALVKAYLSFKDGGTYDDKGGSIAEVAGNEAVYQCYDSKVIVIKNDTCEKSFFVRVVAIGQSPFSEAESKCGE